MSRVDKILGKFTQSVLYVLLNYQPCILHMTINLGSPLQVQIILAKSHRHKVNTWKLDICLSVSFFFQLKLGEQL